jgi:hypothetical protein
MAEKAVPISTATVSIPGFGIRFNGMRLQIERRNYRPSIIDFGVSSRRAKIQRRRLLHHPFHARVMCGSPTQTVLRITPKRCSLSALAPTRRNANGHFHRRFYKEYLHASRLTFNLLLVWG